MPVTVFDAGIFDTLTRVPDPRARRGIRHRLPAILGLALPATCAGARRVIAVDGKTLRGARDAAGCLTHRLATLDHDTGVVLGLVEVGAKINEIPRLTALLDPLDLSDVAVTADALHRQRGAADYIVGRGGHYVFTVKNNQPSLLSRLKALPWNGIPVASSMVGHGRRERCTVKAPEVAAARKEPCPVEETAPSQGQHW
ncbi:ISAs1 family transposase [Rhodococcus marinonascens]|uniref:ISAs1 family transposase n=1 Tax=Rhodococcus marinonascens TaxID=38311 RepID=UPI0009351383|nr:ISAs1 family transposase [Rhodococcus marinonascens]